MTKRQSHTIKNITNIEILKNKDQFRNGNAKT